MWGYLNKTQFYTMKSTLFINLRKVKLTVLFLTTFLLSCHQKNKDSEVGNIPDSVNESLTLTEVPTEAQRSEDGILDMVRQYEELSDFAQAASTVQLEGALRDKAEQFTIFVPTNKAFRSAGIAVDSTNAEQNIALKDIILYHIVPQHTVSEVWKDELSYTTLNRRDITITIRDSIAYVNDAQVVVKDIEGKGGVLQVIDKVLIPDQQQDN